MATIANIKTEMGNNQLVKQDRLEVLVSRTDIKKRFEDLLGKKAPGFISSIISAVKTNPQLKEADPTSILSSAVVAATLDLPINSNLGFAHIVPYSGKAQFQMGWKGFVQLAIRTGKYQTMNSSEVYADELESWNEITGELKLTPQATWKERYKKGGKIIGYAAFFRLTNGFEKFSFMTVDQVSNHGKRYSKAFAKGFGPWVDLFDSMAKKTMIKLLLSKYGILSIEMMTSLEADGAVVKEEGQEQTFEREDMAGDAQEPVIAEIAVKDEEIKY